MGKIKYMIKECGCDDRLVKHLEPGEVFAIEGKSEYILGKSDNGDIFPAIDLNNGDLIHVGKDETVVFLDVYLQINHVLDMP